MISSDEALVLVDCATQTERVTYVKHKDVIVDVDNETIKVPYLPHYIHSAIVPTRWDLVNGVTNVARRNLFRALWRILLA